MRRQSAMTYWRKISLAALIAAGFTAHVAADDAKPRFESTGFLQSLDAFIAEQMAKHRSSQSDDKETVLQELELSLRGTESEEHSLFKLSDSRDTELSPAKNLTDRPDFSSLLAPTGEVRGSYGQDLYSANSRMDLSFGGNDKNPDDRGLEVSLKSAYRLSVQGLPATLGFAGNDIANREYNLGVSVGYSGFGLDASFIQQTSIFDNGLTGFDVGLSYQSASWAARLSLSEYREGADLYGIENEVRNIISVELGASYRLTDNLGLSGGVRYYDYGDRWFVNPENGESQMLFLGGSLKF